MNRAYMPHCDSSILHAPGECDYCDAYPDWQEMREIQRINFTGHDDPGKAPCPSLHFRQAEVRDLWPGNRPGGYQWPEQVKIIPLEPKVEKRGWFWRARRK